jgi:ubiquitin-protein ligase E3 C
VSGSEYGKAVTHELVPGGSSVRVTRANVHQYIHQLAHYKLNVEAAEQCRALRAGFQSMIPLEWIRMFSTRELQLLISGDRRSIDLADMKAHVTYGSGYHPSQPYIQAFWDIVAEMGPEDQGNLLKFVTSCSRQPLLGFSQLQPTFCIQKIPAYASQYTGLEPPRQGEVPRLPSAATCMNLLKLPMYDSVEMLRERLLYAIRSNSGFELS